MQGTVHGISCMFNMSNTTPNNIIITSDSGMSYVMYVMHVLCHSSAIMIAQCVQYEVYVVCKHRE